MNRKFRPFYIAAHVFALIGFAIAQPLYDLLSQQVEFFISHDVNQVEIILFTLFLSAVIPSCIVTLIVLTARVLGRGVACWTLYGVNTWADMKKKQRFHKIRYEPFCQVEPERCLYCRFSDTLIVDEEGR